MIPRSSVAILGLAALLAGCTGALGGLPRSPRRLSGGPWSRANTVVRGALMPVPPVPPTYAVAQAAPPSDPAWQATYSPEAPPAGPSAPAVWDRPLPEPPAVVPAEVAPAEVAPPSAPPAATARCDDTCELAGDGECDDGRPGAGSDLCMPGTDCTDCRG